MDQSGFRAKLKSGALGGVYILGGEEDYLVRYYLTALRDGRNEERPTLMDEKSTAKEEDERERQRKDERRGKDHAKKLSLFTHRAHPRCRTAPRRGTARAATRKQIR